MCCCVCRYVLDTNICISVLQGEGKDGEGLAHVNTHTHTRSIMHVHTITQLSTHLCCHDTELMKRTKERVVSRERVGGRKCWRNGLLSSTILYNAGEDEYEVYSLSVLCSQVSHEFAINFNPTNPFCSGEVLLACSVSSLG